MAGVTKRGTMDQIDRILSGSVSSLKLNKEFLVEVHACIELIETLYPQLSTTPQQEMVMAAVLLRKGMTPELVRRATEEILLSEDFAEKVRYKGHLTAPDFIKHLERVRPHWDKKY